MRACTQDSNMHLSAQQQPEGEVTHSTDRLVSDLSRQAGEYVDVPALD